MHRPAGECRVPLVQPELSASEVALVVLPVDLVLRRVRESREIVGRQTDILGILAAGGARIDWIGIGARGRTGHAGVGVDVPDLGLHACEGRAEFAPGEPGRPHGDFALGDDVRVLRGALAVGIDEMLMVALELLRDPAGIVGRDHVGPDDHDVLAVDLEAGDVVDVDDAVAVKVKGVFLGLASLELDRVCGEAGCVEPRLPTVVVEVRVQLREELLVDRERGCACAFTVRVAGLGRGVDGAQEDVPVAVGVRVVRALIDAVVPAVAVPIVVGASARLAAIEDRGLAVVVTEVVDEPAGSRREVAHEVPAVLRQVAPVDRDQQCPHDESAGQDDGESHGEGLEDLRDGLRPVGARALHGLQVALRHTGHGSPACLVRHGRESPCCVRVDASDSVDGVGSPGF